MADIDIDGAESNAMMADVYRRVLPLCRIMIELLTSGHVWFCLPKVTLN